MGKIKVLHIITRLDRGGSSENTLFSCIGLNKDKFEVSLFVGKTISPDRDLIREAESHGVEFLFIPELIRGLSFLKDIKAFLKIYVFLRKEGFAIVHTHSSKAGFIGRLAAKLAGVPIIIYTPHGHVFYGYFNRFLTRFFISLERWAATFTDKIITLTERGKEEYLSFKIAPPEKFTAIYSGIRFEKFLNIQIDSKLRKKALGLSEDCLVIGTVGRLVPIKGHFYLIDAMRYLLKEIPGVTLLIIGEGPLKHKLESQVDKMGLTQAIKFLNFQENIQNILSILDLFVLPSLNEGMGRVIVEAQISGLPIVATQVGGIPDLVIDGVNGFLISPKNPELLAQAMIKILKNNELAKKMGELGKRGALQKFGAKQMIGKIEFLYDMLLIEKGFLNGT